MPGAKLAGFKGITPKVSPELLADTYAQIAHNVKLYSGDLIPFPVPVVAGQTGQSTSARTIYPLRNPSTDEIVWLSWDKVVNIATPAFPASVGEQRFYYTGDGVPKISTYDLATSGAAPYPVDYFELGIPAPDNQLTTVAATFSAKDVISVARDSGGLCTYVTSTAHNLRSGMVVAVKGFTHYACAYSRSGTTVTVTLNGHGIGTGSQVTMSRTSGSMTDGTYTISSVTTNTLTYSENESGSTSGNVNLDTRAYNTTGSEVIVVDSTTFKIFAPGFEQATYTVTGAKVELAGQTYPRTYTHTWYTYWGEESVGADPSEDLVMKDGQTVTITGLPITKPSVPAKNFIGGVRLYRTISGTQDADYFLIATLWFPQPTRTVSRSSNVSTIKTQQPHNLLPGDRFKLSGCTQASFDITDGEVEERISDYEFSYTQAGADITVTIDTTGVLFHDASERPDEDAALYWGDGTFDFTDNFATLSLTVTLSSDIYDPPPEDLVGLKVIQNNITAGFVRNKLYISEPGKPHAWPTDYEKTIDADIVAIEPIAGFGTAVLTKKYTYILTGSDPATMNLQRLDGPFPCLNAQGVVSMGYGILYPSTEGLVLFTAGNGPRLATMNTLDQDNWIALVDPATVVASYYGDAYFASHSTGSFVFKLEPQGGGYLVTCDQIMTALHNDNLSNRLYFCDDAVGTIKEWDNLEQPNQTMAWKSKVFITKDFGNIGAARIVADYSTEGQNIEDVDSDWEDTEDLWNAANPVEFKVWADKMLIYTQSVSSGNVFRLPRGYRSDTLEISVSGDVRVRAVHLGETPLSLKEV